MNLDWSTNVIKYVLFVFNFIFVISGIVLIAVGVSVKTYYTRYDIFLSNSYSSLPNLLIATGVLIFFISFFGCCGAWKESWFMVFIFTILLILIFILEFSAGVAGYVLRDKTSSYLRSSLLESIPKYQVFVPPAKQTDDATTVMWDTIQYEFECCGASNASDWAVIFDKDPKGNLPSTCCRPVPGASGTTSCSLTSETAIYYKVGCVEGFGRYLKSHAVTIGGVGIVIAFIQLFAIIFSCHLTRTLKNSFYST